MSFSDREVSAWGGLALFKQILDSLGCRRALSAAGDCRRVAVPETITLGKLHDVIQATMGWCDCHLHEFEIAGERYGIPNPEFD